MARPYSSDLRERVVASAESGLSCREAAEQFSVAPSTVVRWMQLKRAHGSPAARPIGRRRPFVLAGELDWLLARLAETPDITLRALLAELCDRGIAVSYYALWHSLDRHGISFKKKPARQRAGPSRRRPQTGTLAAASGSDRPAAAGLHRRDLGEDQHDQDARPLRGRHPASGQSSACTLEDADLRRGATL